jgi:galactose-1-phosphate uridylyltransferase
MSEIRENKITGESVIIAPERAKRGGNLVPVGEQIQTATFLASCPSVPEMKLSRQKNAFGWLARAMAGYSVP